MYTIDEGCDFEEIFFYHHLFLLSLLVQNYVTNLDRELLLLLLLLAETLRFERIKNLIP
jgi:hypothetical protein